MKKLSGLKNITTITNSINDLVIDLQEKLKDTKQEYQQNISII